MSAAKSGALESSAEALARELGPLDPVARVALLLERFGDGLRFASSFGLEDSVVVHLAARARDKSLVEPRIFMLDTGRLHTETCLLYTSPSPRDRTRSRMPSSA